MSNQQVVSLAHHVLLIPCRTFTIHWETTLKTCAGSVLVKWLARGAQLMILMLDIR